MEDRLVDTAYCQNHGNAYPGYFAVLSVKDEGVGIAPDALPRIFDPLFSTKSPCPDGQKRGWGLAIVYTLVRRRGGWIDVESRPEKGTRFEVFIPVSQASQTS
jgi:signal transduction histidine kinase